MLLDRSSTAPRPLLDHSSTSSTAPRPFLDHLKGSKLCFVDFGGFCICLKQKSLKIVCFQLLAWSEHAKLAFFNFWRGQNTQSGSLSPKRMRASRNGWWLRLFFSEVSAVIFLSFVCFGHVKVLLLTMLLHLDLPFLPVRGRCTIAYECGDLTSFVFS